MDFSKLPIEEVLQVVLGEKLNFKEREAFENMHRILNKRSLTYHQENWIRAIAERLKREISSKKVVAAKLPWEKPGYAKPLKPPGR